MSVNWVPSKPPSSWSRLTDLPRPRPARSDTRTAALEVLMQRVRSEYLEMPGLSLTPEQACCLWGVDTGLGRQLLDRLVEDGFLARTLHGTYVRADGR